MAAISILLCCWGFVGWSWSWLFLFFWAARYLIFCFRFSRTGGGSLNFLLILIFILIYISSGPLAFPPSNDAEQYEASFLIRYHYRAVISCEISYVSYSPCWVPVMIVPASYQSDIHRNSSVDSVLLLHLEEIA